MRCPLRFVSALAGGLVVLSSAASAQPATADYRYTITPIYQMDGDLESGGEARYGGLLLALGRSWSLDNRSTLGFGLDFGHLDWRFDNPTGFGGVAPWDQVDRLGLSVPFTYATGGGWSLGVTPTVEYSGEAGARFSDSLEYGALLSMVKPLREGLTLGLGFGVYQRIEETSVFPILIVNWRINDRLRLSNPAPAGPNGPAGLELSYALGSGWELGIGGAYRSNRYRLDQDGPFPGGVGEYRRVPILARLGHRFSDALSLSLYAGVSVGSQLRVEDADGRGLYTEDLDPSATFGLSLAGRF
ncbi:MAG: DUF6268 family outer membrane beta-barrel protein [Bdellovibrio bacteriovorus]